jgi:hypothetical protein
MFEPVKYFSRRLEWTRPLSRLNRALFLMVIDSVYRTVLYSRGKSAFNITSNFIRSNQ